MTETLSDKELEFLTAQSRIMIMGDVSTGNNEAVLLYRKPPPARKFLPYPFTRIERSQLELVA